MNRRAETLAPRAALQSLDLHLGFPPETIVETASLEDTACGIYPAYYLRQTDRLRVSTSAAALIAASGHFDINPAFRPREYLRGIGPRALFVRATGAVPKFVKDSIKTWLPRPLLRAASRDRFWYETWDTVDTRVHKLRPFERVTPSAAERRFQPDFTLQDAGELAEGVALHVRRFVERIEITYPEHDHILMVGGKDSQLLTLIPKRNPRRWHVYSAAPNHDLVARWLARNQVPAGELFGHDNRNEETAAETRQKILCSDLYSDPRHMRWLPTLRRLAERFGRRCFFWQGSAADALHVGRAFHRRDQRENPSAFFDIHLTRVPCLVGNYHQVVKNFTGCALLCPYQTAEIWRDVYRHHGPGVIAPGVDLRPRIGELLAGRPIQWDESNPGPAPYRYHAVFHARAAYLAHIQGAVTATASATPTPVALS